MKTKRNVSSILSIMSAVGITLLLLLTAFSFQLTGSETVNPPGNRGSSRYPPLSTLTREATSFEAVTLDMEGKQVSASNKPLTVNVCPG
jgi:hypothetical protein